ncbi:MAG: hypothetical protein HY897_21700 [Deltaproteobacteria bacterium]|nr:hypothetical protein [Deltaproteobacteria bacterium]
MNDFQMLSGTAGRELVHFNTEIGGVTVSFYDAHTSWNVDGNIECRALADEMYVIPETLE